MGLGGLGGCLKVWAIVSSGWISGLFFGRIASWIKKQLLKK